MIAIEEICEQDIPDSLRDIRDVIGFAATIALVRYSGGTRISIPKRQGSSPYFETALIRTVGREACVKLMEVYGGETLSIPRAHKALLCLRNRRIVEEYDGGGTTAGRLALKYGLTERQVQNILGRPPVADERQGTLDFGE